MMRCVVIISTFFTVCASAQELQDLKPILDAQIGKPLIEIPKGKYLLDNFTHGAYEFSDLKDVCIIGDSADIVCNTQDRAFAFLNCVNVEFSGVSIDYDPLCFTQGEIVAIGDDRSWFELLIDDGYPVENVTNDRVQFYDWNSRELKQNSITTYTNHYADFRKLDTRRFRLEKSWEWDAGETVGDLVVLNVKSTKANVKPHAIYVEKSENMRFVDVAVYGSNSFSFYEKECTGLHYNRCKVTRGPSKPGIAPRLRSGNADGIHSSFAVKGPVVENCEVGYNGDDGIIVCSRSFPVYKIDSLNKQIYVLNRVVDPPIRAGDLLRQVQYDGQKGSEIRTTQVEACTVDVADAALIMERYPQLLFKDRFTSGICISMADWPATFEVGDIIYNETRAGSGFKIINNRVGNTRSRGILIKGNDGVISGNLIENCAMNGILVAPEIQWMGGGFSDNLLVEGNSIVNCLFEKSTANLPPGAISVFYVNGKMELPPNPGTFNNIEMLNNNISKCPLPGVALIGIRGLVYDGNTVAPHPMQRRHGTAFDVTFDSPLWEKNVSYLETSTQQ